MQWFILPISQWLWRWPHRHVLQRGPHWWPVAAIGGIVYGLAWALCALVVVCGFIILAMYLFQFLAEPEVFTTFGDAATASHR